MNTYHKIQTVWLRDPDTGYKTLLEDQWALEEFEYLRHLPWTWREKIDGTNTRIMWMNEGWEKDPMAFPLEFRGKKDTSDMRKDLHARLQEIFTVKDFKRMFPDKPVCLYGEGCGNRIQKAGKYLNPNGLDFILFDVRVGHFWLRREAIEQVADGLGIKVAPIIGEGTLEEMIDVVRAGYQSTISEKPLLAEGIIATPKIELQGRNGRRVITKIKHKDFPPDQRGELFTKIVPA